MDILKWLQLWFDGNCDRELDYGVDIKIETLDNPGWLVKINLIGTRYENKFNSKIEQDNGDSDWIVCFINSSSFEGAGDSYKLGEIIEVFREWIGNSVTVK